MAGHIGPGLGNDIREEAFVRACLENAVRAAREAAYALLPRRASAAGKADPFGALVAEGVIGAALAARLRGLDALERLVASGYELGNLRVVKDALDEHTDVFQRFVDAVQGHGLR
jgi:uncharacterized protein YutE (UPF0331/DUF86 family)